MAEPRELFITGLKNAHAMENQAHEMLERQIERMKDYPDMRAKLRDHLGETKQQLKRLESCLAELDSTPPTVKDMTLGFGANLAAIGHAVATDEVLKNTFANSALKAYETSYRSLLVLAEEAGARMKTVLQESLREEEHMAEWVQTNGDEITRAFVTLERKQAA